MELPKDRIDIASDVAQRNGIGIELYRDNKLLVEIFRDDTKLTRTVTVFEKEVTLEILEEAIKAFRNKIPWDFIN